MTVLVFSTWCFLCILTTLLYLLSALNQQIPPLPIKRGHSPIKRGHSPIEHGRFPPGAVQAVGEAGHELCTSLSGLRWPVERLLIASTVLLTAAFISRASYVR